MNAAAAVHAEGSHVHLEGSTGTVVDITGRRQAETR